MSLRAWVEHVLDAGLLPQLRVQVEALDQLGQPVAAEDLLLDDVEPALELAADGRPDDRLRNRPLDQHQRRGAIQVRQVEREGDRGAQAPIAKTATASSARRRRISSDAERQRVVRSGGQQVSGH